MSRLMSLCSAAALLVFATGVVGVQAGRRAVTLAVIMTNDPISNQIKVYDVSTNTSCSKPCPRTARAASAATPEASNSTTASCSRPSTTAPTPSPSISATETASGLTSW